LESRSSKQIYYHFELAYDDQNQKWFFIDDFEGMPLHQIRDNGRWRDPLLDSEKTKLARRRAELEGLIKALNSGKE
jgi:hypothetical protein